MKHVAILVAKAAVAATLTMVVVDHVSTKLPEALVVGGKDIRPYVVGTAVMAALMWAGSHNKLGPAGDIVKPAA